MTAFVQHIACLLEQSLYLLFEHGFRGCAYELVNHFTVPVEQYRRDAAHSQLSCNVLFVVYVALANDDLAVVL